MQSRTVSATDSNVMVVIESVINIWLAEVVRVPTDTTADQAARIQASADSIDTLVEQLTETVRQTAVEFDRTAKSVQIDGLRPIESGWRIWGTVGLTGHTGSSDFDNSAPIHASVDIHGSKTTVSLTYPMASNL
jgi:hypothetical protein